MPTTVTPTNTWDASATVVSPAPGDAGASTVIRDMVQPLVNRLERVRVRMQCRNTDTSAYWVASPPYYTTGDATTNTLNYMLTAAPTPSSADAAWFRMPRLPQGIQVQAIVWSTLGSGCTVLPTTMPSAALYSQAYGTGSQTLIEAFDASYATTAEYNAAKTHNGTLAAMHTVDNDARALLVKITFGNGGTMTDLGILDCRLICLG